jgi:hypothetical protein
MARRNEKIKIGDIVQLITDFNSEESKQVLIKHTFFKVLDIEQGYFLIQKLDSKIAAIYVPKRIVAKASKASQVLFR